MSELSSNETPAVGSHSVESRLRFVSPPVWFRAQRPRKATCGTRGASRPTYYITSNDAIRRQALDCENTAVDVDLRTCDVGRLIGRCTPPRQLPPAGALE